MKVSVIAKIMFDDNLGKLVKGQTVELPDHKARFYIERGDVEFYATKIVHESPLPMNTIQPTEEKVVKRKYAK